MERRLRPFGFQYRDLSRLVLRRVHRVAGEVNACLVVIALGLLMLDFVCAAQRFVDALPPVVQATARMP